MTDTKYPLCEKAGLKVYRGVVDKECDHPSFPGVLAPRNALVVCADDLEALLANAPVVYGTGMPEAHAQHGWVTEGWRDKDNSDTHTARLLLIEKLPTKCPTCGKDGYENHHD